MFGSRGADRLHVQLDRGIVSPPSKPTFRANASPLRCWKLPDTVTSAGKMYAPETLASQSQV